MTAPVLDHQQAPPQPPPGRPYGFLGLGQQAWTVIAILAALVFAGATYVFYYSDFFTLKQYVVNGIEPDDQIAVKNAIDLSSGLQLARIDTAEVERKLRELGWVNTADISIRWPDTVAIDIKKRVPIAYLPVSDSKYAVIDNTGAVFASPKKKPDNLPELVVPEPETDSWWNGLVPAALQKQAIETIAFVPADIRDNIATFGNERPDQVWFKLASGETVMWGQADQPAYKAEVLRALLATAKGSNWLDVRLPNLPTTAGSSPKPVAPPKPTPKASTAPSPKASPGAAEESADPEGGASLDEDQAPNPDSGFYLEGDDPQKPVTAR